MLRGNGVYYCLRFDPLGADGGLQNIVMHFSESETILSFQKRAEYTRLGA
jgi:hypothetical protein